MEFFKRAIIGISVGIILSVLGIFGLIHMNNTQTGTLTHTEKFNGEITIDPARQASFQPIAPYKTMDVFLSDVEISDFEFTSVGSHWIQDVPQGTNVISEIRFRNNGEFSEWLRLDPEDFDPEDPSVKTAVASTNIADAVQYRFLLSGDGTHVPTIKDLEWTFIKTRPQRGLTLLPSLTLAMGGGTVNADFVALNSDPLNIITRKNWGADESYRYLIDGNISPDLVELPTNFYNEFKDELKYSRVVATDSGGKKYRWPLQYPESVKKIIIHHTATTGNLDNPAQAIRDIYHYHAISRAWGDIGYNYIIDAKGKIYEGRYGGKGVIGAHAGPGNNGSIGIAVLGDYEQNQVPKPVIVSLAKLIGVKSKINHIDPTGGSVFRGKLMPNVFGHKDIMATSCPGANLYGRIPMIRSLAKSINTDKPKNVKDYDYQDRSDLYYVELKPDETREITIKMENIGKKDWDNKTFIVANQNPAFNGFISFPTASNEVLAKIQESVVHPGGTATFKFKIKAAKKGDTAYMDLTVLANGWNKVEDYIELPVTVLQTDYRYQYLNAALTPLSMSGGEKFTATVKLKNTGNITWRRTGENTVKLGTDHPRDRKSKFLIPPDTRIGFLNEDKVAPGETGTFTMELTAPVAAGYYKEYFTPVVEGVTWMADSGMYFETTVVGGNYDSEIVSTSPLTDWKQSKSYVVWAKLRNLGKQTWEKPKMTFDFINEKALKIENPRLESDTVKTGEIGMISFQVTLDSQTKLGKKSILFYPKMAGNKITSRPVYFNYHVSAGNGIPQTSNTGSTTPVARFSNPDIRVKLGFSGVPQISATGGFAAYKNGKLLQYFKAGTNSKLTFDNKNDIVRFVPDQGSILKIDNFSHSPSWTPTLNDNQYRGTLEVRYVDGKLTIIDELPLEDYLKGLAEAANSDPAEKIKAVIVAARSYARFYIEKAEKFPGKPYNLDDDPAVSQKYLGYGFEMRSANITKAVTDTSGQVVTYDGALVKTPYFSSTDGTMTRSAMDVWKWDAKYLIPVSDSYCKNTKFAGHGVGLSGCGAKGMADAGFNYKDILKHYYTGVDIVTVP